MTRSLLFFVLCLPGLASAEIWRWVDAAGRPHYSNVPEHVPAGARQIRGDVGYVGAGMSDGEWAEATAVEPGLSATRRLGEVRRIKRRLADIQRFRAQVRQRQLARLQAYATSTLLPDWMTADRWLAMQEEERKLEAALQELTRPLEPAS